MEEISQELAIEGGLINVGADVYLAQLDNVPGRGGLLGAIGGVLV